MKKYSIRGPFLCPYYKDTLSGIIIELVDAINCFLVENGDIFYFSIPEIF